MKGLQELLENLKKDFVEMLADDERAQIPIKAGPTEEQETVQQGSGFKMNI